MTAAEAVIRAHAAGLTLTPHPKGLLVAGPKQIRGSLLPVLRPLTADILRLLAGASSGALEPRPPCSECGRIDWIVTVIMEDGDRYCPGCLAGAVHAT